MKLSTEEKAYLAAWLKEDSIRHDYGPAHDLARENGVKYPDLVTLISAYFTTMEQLEIAEQPAVGTVEWPWTPQTFADRLHEAGQLKQAQRLGSAAPQGGHAP